MVALGQLSARPCVDVQRGGRTRRLQGRKGHIVKRTIAPLLALIALIVAAPAGATEIEKGWICHATNSESNPFVLLHVPTNSAHFTKHLGHGDKLAADVEDAEGRVVGHSCGEDGQPTPPFTGALTFNLDNANCDEGEVGVPGFTVILETFKDSEKIDEQIIFTFPSTCIAPAPGATGPAGPAGPQGPAGPAGPAGKDGANGTSAQSVSRQSVAAKGKCTSKRTLSIRLPRGYHGRITALVSGKRQTVRVDSRRRIRLTFRGVKCGIGSVVIRKRGLKPVVRIYTLGPDGNLTSFNVPLPR